MILVHIDGMKGPGLFNMSDAISGEPKAASDSPTPQLSVLKANVEERVAPRIVDWSEATTEMYGRLVCCTHQEDFALVCAVTEEQLFLTLRGLRFSAT